MERSLEDMLVGEIAYIDVSSVCVCNLDILFYERRWVLSRRARIFSSVADQGVKSPLQLLRVCRRSANSFSLISHYEEALPKEESITRITDPIRLGAYFENVTVTYDPEKHFIGSEGYDR